MKREGLEDPYDNLERFKELLFEAHKCYLGSDRLISMNDIYKYLFEDN